MATGSSTAKQKALSSSPSLLIFTKTLAPETTPFFKDSCKILALIAYFLRLLYDPAASGTAPTKVTANYSVFFDQSNILDHRFSLEVGIGRMRPLAESVLEAIGVNKGVRGCWVVKDSASNVRLYILEMVRVTIVASSGSASALRNRPTYVKARCSTQRSHKLWSVCLSVRR